MRNKTLLLALFFIQVGIIPLYSNATNKNELVERKLNSKVITLDLKETSIKQIFSEIEKQIKSKFIYRSDQSFLQSKISISIINQDLDKVLHILGTKANLDFKITNSGILVKELQTPIKKQPRKNKRISGTVTDEKKIPIPGASVNVLSTSLQSITDTDGKFMLDIPSDSKLLAISYMGFETKEVTIENGTIFNIVLKETTSQLEEILVTGYGSEKRRNITGSVASVKMKEISSQPKSNVVEMLEGRLAGVQIMSDNSPGGGTSVRIRGFSTINNNDPLVIVDGVPASNGLNGINPSDIESLQVLKDAASSSIYGSRAANGVVLITTKKGSKKESLQMQFDGYSGVQVAFNLPEMLNAQQYGDLLWQATKNDGKVPSNAIYGNDPNNAVIPEYLNATNTIKSGNVNWLKEILHPAVIHSYNLSLSKGDDKAQQFFSLGYFNQDGIIRHTNFDRFSARFNSSYKIKDVFTIGQNLSTSYTTQVAAATNSSLGSIVYDALQFPSIVPVYDIDGNFAGNPINDISNPLGKLTRAKDNQQKRIQALGNVFATLELGNFTFHTSLGLDYQSYNYRGFSPIYNEILSQSVKNDLTTSNSFNYQLTGSNTINYKKQSNNHNIDALVGQEAIKYYYEDFSASRQSFLYEDLNFRYLSYGTENQLNSGTANQWALNSYFGRLNYNYSQKYLFTATVRRDGTSKLANNKWGTFPSFSGGWRIDKEDFFSSNSKFSSFLLRASWGQTGNQQLPSYSTVDSYSNNSNYSNYAISGLQSEVAVGLTQTRVANANLAWETTTQKTLGVDMGFFKDKLMVTAEVYDKVTNDILVYNVVPITYGGTNDGQWINDGQMSNRGYELNINYKNAVKDFSYDLALNLTGNQNKLTALSVPYLGIPTSSLHTVNFDQEISRSAVGQPIGSFYGFVADGLFRTEQEVADYGLQPNAQPGDLKFKDVNGDGELNTLDRTFIGSPHPKLMLGFNVNLKYKQLDLGMFFNGNFGNKLYNLTKYKTQFFNQSAYNKDIALLDAWTVDNPNSNIPRLSLDDSNNNIRPSSYYVEDGSYFKLNNLQLGYTFKPEIIGGIKLRLYGQASNVFTITKYSGMTPQIGLQSYSSSNRNLDIGVDRGIYPPSRTFVFGCNLNF
ncbi:SusC/RagA family TonB-linked outer membrane protein [Flavobacterium algicola]|uniref:SusC/RagA family TonB-linked outer membrane protein n=1 Tax=Flavobacterium algicola TaxID=556529 RepID=UPI001EFD501D|nr:TonB-dependent receptor [Flavobacterium algicola]MCG9793536.1 TonB-dependent receptor [Flavobacterium algicola]